MSRPAAAIALLYIAFFPPAGGARAEPAGGELISEQWMEIRMQGDKIGFSYQKTERTAAGYRVTSKSVIKLQVADITQDISLSQTYFFDRQMKPKRFSYIQKMLGHRQHFEGIVTGDKLEITITSAGTVTKRTLPFDEDMQFADAVDFILNKKKLEEGLQYRFKVFLEPLLATEEIEVKVEKKVDFDHNGKTQKAWRVVTSFKNFTVVSFIAEDGRVLKEVSPLGFESVAVPQAQAISFSEGVVPFTNLLTFSLIATDSPVTEPEKIQTLNLRISGLTDGALIPEDGRQEVTGVIKETGGAGSYTALVKTTRTIESSIGKTGRPAPARGMVDYLKPTFEAQSDNPLIQKQAKEIVKGIGDVYQSAVAINRWVYKNVEKKFVDTFSAVATLKSLEGECQSHTNLFAAMAKSVGIPTRTASGIVYSKQFNGFLYHAWPEIHAGGKWIAMDPTLGQDIADATHIKLIDGELSKQLQLFEYIGKIGIEVVSAEYNQ